VAVNCAALAKGLLESELFGHIKGAFTGASAPQGGYIRAAQGGTLFLDEIGETTPEFQVRLLRVLEDRVVVPVGSAKGQRVDFRLVCATSRDLDEAARQGAFNQALLWRVEVVPITLPPLRQRREDLPALIDHFLAKACLAARRTRRLSPELRGLLRDYAWPGNVRQLRHLLERLVALAEEFEISPAHLPADLRAALSQGGDYLPRLEAVAGLPANRVKEVAALLSASAGAEVSNRDLRTRLGCSDSTAKNILKALAEAGLLTASGDRGGRRYKVV
jgi:DNA-binding NtrC family response regulator